MSHPRWLWLAIPILGSLVSACRTGSKEPTGAGNITAATASPTPIGPSAAQSERMPHCPSVVAGATTLVDEVPGGVELGITAAGDGANEIRKRALFLASAGEATRGKRRATGGGRAQFGRCPIVMRNTTLETREIPGGVAVVVRPSDATELAWLRREVEARSAQLGAPKPFGSGLMKLCPSAVANAQTTVHDAPYGVDVKVTEATDAGMRAIRERAKALAAQGTTFDERCPATPPSVALVVSDVPGGATIAIKAKHLEDIGSLRHNVRERLRSFEPPVLK